MPNYKFRCEDCGYVFDNFYFTYQEAKTKEKCSKCGGEAKKVFTAPAINVKSREVNKEFADDPKEYREMHYYEKNKQWRKAAKAAEGVSDFAKNKFIKKAHEEESK